jgi:hypothetical protein
VAIGHRPCAVNTFVGGNVGSVHTTRLLAGRCHAPCVRAPCVDICGQCGQCTHDFFFGPKRGGWRKATNTYSYLTEFK